MMIARLLLLSILANSHGEVTSRNRIHTDEPHSKLGDETCGTSQNHRTKRHDRVVFPGRPPSGDKYGNALEFEKGEVIRYFKLRNPSKKFTVDFWMKPEGGQHNPTVVLGAFDKCAPEQETRGWFIGLREASVKSDLRVSFTLRTASAPRNTTIMSHRKIDVHRWIHVAATYDGRRMKLYVNQAKVDVGYGQKGLIFESTTQGQACDLLEIGGDVKNGFYYRGQIDKLRLWSDAISHKELTASLPDNTVDDLTQKVFMFDDFDDDNKQNLNWIPTTGKYPRFVRSTVPEEKHDLSLRKPPCGMTICDNPEVVRSYLKHTEMRGHKRLRLRVINVMDDDGKRPTVTERQIRAQHHVIKQLFAPYNISWELEVVRVKDTWLRGKTVLHNCEAAQIGDGTCNTECRYDVTGSDGGDCSPKSDCSPEKRGNGECDLECNKGYYDWDGGDCCNPKVSPKGAPPQACYDPKSPHRAYLSVKDYKKRIDLDNRDALNVFVAKWRDKKLQGIATLPWEKDVHTELGGVVVPPSHFRTTNHTKVLVHELGHVLGLWHVHHGSVSEMFCTDDCFENFPSLELGDLCSDTNPTILNTKCAEPEVSSQATCGLPRYTNTPFKNYMGYADDSCTNHFTPQQIARMHCYIDQDYQSWQTNAKPSIVPLPPRITSATENSIKLSWIPPLGSGGSNAKNLCNECEEDKILEQYASTAYSPILSKPTGNYAPHQATGFPDAEPCTAGPLSWRPDFIDSRASCKDCSLYIELGFKEPVVPTAITIWVSWEANEAFSDIELISTDGSVKSIGNGTAQCDSPYTRPLYVDMKVSKVRIHVSRKTVSIDAVKLTSGVGHPNCSKCEPLEYIITRDPPFDTGPEARVSITRYEDRNIDKSGRYEYRVRAVTDENLSSPLSPALIYKPQNGFCGDGKIDKGEECDDGNVRDGDGCNVQCQMEDVFHCDGRPSLCYRHDGDGVCEEFEKKTSIKDCGFYTPDDFQDQWVNSALASPKPRDSEDVCPESVIVGPPRSDLKCQTDFPSIERCTEVWSPSYITILWEWIKPVDVWLMVSFRRPAIASAIIVYLSHVPKYFEKITQITFKLMDPKKQEKMSVEHAITNFCKENPFTVPIRHDMTKPFFKTQHLKLFFSSDDVGIAAVSLRSPKHFDPVELQNCASTELFHPRTQKCRQYKCNVPECPKLVVKHSQEVTCKKSKRDGDVCSVKCRKGFIPGKQFEAICSSGEWLVDGEVPQCTPVDCGLPIIQNAKPDCRGGTTYGKKCSYNCDKSTVEVGPGTDRSVTCEEDGLWSAANVFCRKTCRKPQVPLNARSLSKSCHNEMKVIAGLSCKYRCKNGYMAGGFTRTDLFKKTCMKDGTWSGPRCLPVRCPVSSQEVFRWYNCSFGNTFGSVCRLTCPVEKNNREIRCLADGKWDKKFRLCLTKGECPSPSSLSNGQTIINCNTGLGPGKECQVKCPEDYEPGIQIQSTRQRIDSIACSPMFQWHPDPGAIKCLMKCDTTASGDGYCDGKNNNEDCNWDGGDCCDSTAKFGVTRTEHLCDNNCSCQDPNGHDYFGSGGLPS